MRPPPAVEPPAQSMPSLRALLGEQAQLEAANAELQEKRARIASLFEARGVSAEARRNGDAYRLCEIFAALLAMSDEKVMEVLAFTMAQTLEAGGPVVEAVLHVCETDLSAYWKPDAAFFDLLRDKRAINAMVADIGSKSLADSCASDTAKVQKQIIGNRIMGHGCDPNPDWRPAWMQVPPARLVEGIDVRQIVPNLAESEGPESDPSFLIP